MPCNTPPPPSPFDDMGEEMEDAFEMMPNQDEDIEFEEIIEEPDDAAYTFGEHMDGVFCCNLNRSGELAVSGGQDEVAYVWNTDTGETKFECTGHTDSVIVAQFNYDSTLVATGGMDGLIQVWNVDSGEKVWSYETNEITWMTWHSKTNLIFAGNSDGNCWKLNTEDYSSNTFPTSGSGTSCGQLLADGSKCAVGYMDGSVRIWDTNSCSVLGSATGNDGHVGDVISIACSADSNLIATGSDDETTKLIKVSNCKVLHTWNYPAAVGDDKETIESIAFFKSHPLLATGSNTGNLRIFDISTHAQRVVVNVKHAPIVKILCSETSPLIYVATNEAIQLYDGRTAQLEKSWKGHTLQILDFVLSTFANSLWKSVLFEWLFEKKLH